MERTQKVLELSLAVHYDSGRSSFLDAIRRISWMLSGSSEADMQSLH